MKSLFLFLSTLIVLSASCTNTERTANTLLSTSLLETDTYSIDISKDNSIISKKGAIITIPAGAIESDSQFVTIELKEAFSMKDIVRAGLTTQSNGLPLSSGGMIYINTVQSAAIRKPIRIYIPTDRQRMDMKAFVGSADNLTNINWRNAVPVSDTPRQLLETGGQLFTQNCASCHNPYKSATGPALAGITSRRNKEWLYAFTRNSAQLIASGDVMANTLYNIWGKTAMTAFPNLSDKELDLLYAYLDNMEYNGEVEIADKCYDSCMALMRDRKFRAPVTDTASYNNFNTVSVGNMVVPPYNGLGYYSFAITAVGWYNVDIVTKGLPGFEESTLTATVTGGEDLALHVYLVLPSEKMFLVGGLVKGQQNGYAFFTDDSKILLPHGRQAFILAMVEKDGQVLYGQVEFTTAVAQTPALALQAMTKDAFNTAIEALNFDGVGVSDLSSDNNVITSSTVNETESRETGNLHATGCDCPTYK
ncbi:MAG: cytochrome c [Chitinophagales bacterium]|nr:cytochrome c [Chitinophagales bacterium]